MGKFKNKFLGLNRKKKKNFFSIFAQKFIFEFSGHYNFILSMDTKND